MIIVIFIFFGVYFKGYKVMKMVGKGIVFEGYFIMEMVFIVFFFVGVWVMIVIIKGFLVLII